MERAAAEAPVAWAHSDEAEQSLLGALLLDARTLPRVAEIVEASDFYYERHRAIFGAIAASVRRGGAGDVVAVSDWLERKSAEAFESYGGAVYLAALVQSTPSSLNALHYAKLVREKALYRRLHALGQELASAARAPGARDLAALAIDARARLALLADTAAPGRTIRAHSAVEFIDVELPELEPLLAPWLFQKNLVMVHARRGVGKTHFALACAFAIASGGRFLEWDAPKPRGVLYVDGEMPAQLMQRRLRELMSGSGDVPERLRLVTPDLQEKPMPDLATAAGQAEVDELVEEDTALIVVDNLSCLVRSGGAENESESWTAVAEWALRHRRAGRAVLFVHHSGKNGAQRGTSKREDLLDVVIGLRRPNEYQETDGAVFEIHFEKARSLTGDGVAPLEAKLEQAPGGGQVWSWNSAATRTCERIKTLWDGGVLTLLDVARECGCSKGYCHKTLAAAMAAGELVRAYPAKPRKETK